MTLFLAGLRMVVVLPIYLFIAIIGAFTVGLIGASVLLAWLVGVPLTVTRGSSKVRYRWFKEIK